MIDKIINSRFFIIILFALVFFESKEFVFRSINKFYLFEIEKTAVTRGIITKAILQDGIGGRAYKCTFSYQTNGLLFKNSETQYRSILLQISISEILQPLFTA